METLVQQGKVIYVGSSNFAGWNIALAQAQAHRRNFMGLVSEQSLYHLNARMIEPSHPGLQSFWIGPDSLESTGRRVARRRAEKKAAQGRRSDERLGQMIEKNRAKLEAYEALCQEMGEKPAGVALAWLLHNPVVTAPIIGLRTLEQLQGSLRAVELKLSDDVIKKLDEIFPGPGGQAPKAYAW